MATRLHRCLSDLVVCGHRVCSESGALAFATVAAASPHSAALPRGFFFGLFGSVQTRPQDQAHAGATFTGTNSTPPSPGARSPGAKRLGEVQHCVSQASLA